MRSAIMCLQREFCRDIREVFIKQIRLDYIEYKQREYKLVICNTFMDYSTMYHVYEELPNDDWKPTKIAQHERLRGNAIVAFLLREDPKCEHLRYFSI